MHLSLVSHADHASHFTDAAGRLPDVTMVEMNDNPDAVAVLAGAANPLETCRLAAARRAADSDAIPPFVVPPGVRAGRRRFRF